MACCFRPLKMEREREGEIPHFGGRVDGSIPISAAANTDGRTDEDEKEKSLEDDGGGGGERQHC